MRQFCPQAVEDKVVLENPNVPVILGDFTNWQPKPMLSIVEFCQAIHLQTSDEQVM